MCINAQNIRKDSMRKEENEESIVCMCVCGIVTGNAVSIDLCNQIMSFDSDEEVERLVTKIMDVYGLPNRFIIGPCPRIPSAVATVDKKGAPAILYNPDFLKKIKVFSFTASDLPTESEDWGVLLVFAHEIGHHLCNHITSPHPDLTQRDMELED